MEIIQNYSKLPHTLNNADGFNHKQMSVVNRAVIAIRNQWDKKTIQKVSPQSLGNGIYTQGGYISANKAYRYNGLVTVDFTFSSEFLSVGQTYKMFTTYTDIIGVSLDGNGKDPWVSDYDFYNFFLLSFEGNAISITKIGDTDLVFSCHISIGVK